MSAVGAHCPDVALARAEAADDAAGAMPGQGGVIAYLQPAFGKPAAVEEDELFVEGLAHLRAVGASRSLHLYSYQVIDGQEQGEEEDEGQGIADVIQQAPARDHGPDNGHSQQSQRHPALF